MIHVCCHEEATIVLGGPVQTRDKDFSFFVVRVLRWFWQRVDQGELMSLKDEHMFSSGSTIVRNNDDLLSMIQSHIFSSLWAPVATRSPSIAMHSTGYLCAQNPKMYNVS